MEEELETDFLMLYKNIIQRNGIYIKKFLSVEYVIIIFCLHYGYFMEIFGENVSKIELVVYLIHLME